MSGVLSSGSATVVASGHSASHLLIRVFDTLLVASGGTVTDSHVTDAGLVTVGGSPQRDPGGSALVYGTIISTLVDQEFVSGGQTFTGPGGVVTLGAHGLADDTVISGGVLYVNSGAAAHVVTDAG
jgi:hypothetical protein